MRIIGIARRRGLAVRRATARAYQNVCGSTGRSRSYSTSPVRTMRVTSGSTDQGNSRRNAWASQM